MTLRVVASKNHVSRTWNAYVIDFFISSSPFKKKKKYYPLTNSHTSYILSQIGIRWHIGTLKRIIN